MDKDIYKLSLGMPFEVGDYYIVHPLTIKEIIELGYERLQGELGLFLLDWDNVSIDVPDEQKTNENLYDTIKKLYLESPEFFDNFNKACELFLKRPLVKNLKSIDYKTHKRVGEFFKEETYGRIREILKKQYLIGSNKEKEEKMVFANERARKLHEQLEQNTRRAEKFKRNKLTFIDYVVAIRWKTGMPKQELLGMSLYELFDGLKRLQTNDKASNLISAIYAGTINPKSIEDEELTWIRHIEL